MFVDSNDSIVLLIISKNVEIIVEPNIKSDENQIIVNNVGAYTKLVGTSSWKISVVY